MKPEPLRFWNEWPAGGRAAGEDEPENRSFRFQGRTYTYFDHPYNNTAANERRVEIPLALAALEQFPGPVLEVGNVLAHYGVSGQTVVDKYEVGEGVLNVDIEQFVPEQPFGLIVSISTLEHLGWDEQPRDPDKPGRVLARLARELLAPGGHLLATVPLGYNPHLDAHLLRRETGTELAFLRRVNAANEWREIGWAELGLPRYGDPFPNGNVVAVLSL